MQLKKQFFKVLAFIKHYLNTPAKAGVFMSMIIWSILVRILITTFQTNKIIKILNFSLFLPNISVEQTIFFLNFLERLGVIKSKGDCLARSLIYYRYLRSAGETPTIFIGFSDNKGHAWVEINGMAIGDSLSTLVDFKPVLMLQTDGYEFIPVP